MSKRTTSFWLSLLTLLLAGHLFLGFQVCSRAAEADGDEDAFQKVGVLMHVLYLIRQDFVDESKTGYTDLLYSAMQGMVSSLDPFSGFMTPAEHAGMVEMTEGKFGGLGITVTMRRNVLTVVAPIAGSPASRAGVLPGDQIAGIEGASTEGMSMDEAVSRLKGEPGTAVTLTLFRPATQATLELTLERAVIDIPTVTDARVFDGQIGYLRITEFSEPTAARLHEALRDLQREPLAGLVLDLRNNPGGLLTSAVDVCSHFLPARRQVVSTAGRRASQRQEFLTDSRPKLPAALPLVVLINQGSASAAEIVAGCLQDWGRATLIGETSFGKGSVQSLIELGDGSALRLTTAMYQTPSKRVIHEHGIAPDVEVRISEAELRRLLDREPEESARGPDPALDPQLARALEVLRGYVLFRKAQESRFRQPRAEEPATPAEP
jgi:carboxyl-terminal processing protease